VKGDPDCSRVTASDGRPLGEDLGVFGHRTELAIALTATG
jgi:hypothetical protein